MSSVLVASMLALANLTQIHLLLCFCFFLYVFFSVRHIRQLQWCRAAFDANTFTFIFLKHRSWSKLTSMDLTCTLISRRRTKKKKKNHNDVCVCVEGYISNMVSRIDFLLHICFLVSNSRVTHLFTMVFVGVTVLWLQINVVIVLKNLISHRLTKKSLLYFLDLLLFPPPNKIKQQTR